MDRIRDTHAIMSSVMRCELSIRPRSASRLSAADERCALYALESVSQEVQECRECILDVVSDIMEQVDAVQGLLQVCLQELGSRYSFALFVN